MRTKLAPTLALLFVASLADAQRLSVRPNVGRAIDALQKADGASPPAPGAPMATARAWPLGCG